MCLQKAGEISRSEPSGSGKISAVIVAVVACEYDVAHPWAVFMINFALSVRRSPRCRGELDVFATARRKEALFLSAGSRKQRASRGNRILPHSMRRARVRVAAKSPGGHVGPRTRASNLSPRAPVSIPHRDRQAVLHRHAWCDSLAEICERSVFSSTGPVPWDSMPAAGAGPAVPARRECACGARVRGV